MDAQHKCLRCAWWNVYSFAHFETSRAGESRWPSSQEEYTAKSDRLAAALEEIFSAELPEVMGVAEITRTAAIELRDRLFPNYEVMSLDGLPRSELQVAFIYDPTVGFKEASPIVVPMLPRGTRPMAVLDHISTGHQIRFVACHWTARFGEQSAYHRADTARYLSQEIYKFFHEEPAQETVRHVVVLGDLNEEPFGLLEERLHAARNREHSKRRAHYTDEDVGRVRLYNCAWRFLGERRPHDGRGSVDDAAGTFYWREKLSWHTFDHVIVSGSLLTENVPFLDERCVGVVVNSKLFGHDMKPLRFEWNNGKPRGLSDHLPIVGRIAFQRENTNAQS